jgi:hypothetical protein
MERRSRNNDSKSEGKDQARPKFSWTDLRKHIEFYEREGLRYIPLVWGDKKPAIKSWRPFQNRAPTSEELASWFHESKPANIGIICGAASGGLVALCFNTPRGALEFFGEELWQKLLNTTFVTQTYRGVHVLLRSDTPIKNQFVPKGGIPSWLEIRYEGNYVVVPPSLHPEGVFYQPIGVESIDSPKNLVDFIDQRLSQLGLKIPPPRETPKGISGNEPGWVQQALKGVPEGERDSTCTRLAGYFKNHLPQDVSLSVLISWGERCAPPFPPQDIEKVVASVYRYGEPIRDEPEEQAGLPPTPELPEDVWQGLFWDYRDMVAGTTEAPDNYHYVCFAQTLGATLGRRIHIYHARRLFPNFYICLVGRTAITRKDTARYRAQQLLNDLHSEENPEDPQFQILPGIGSAEGLLDALGGERKVVILSESELLSLLAKARQEALSNLIPKLTSLFDCPDLETLKTRQRTVVCKEPFLSISSGTTLAWLQKALTEKDIYGGFANRFIFVYGIPKPPLPFPPKVDAAAYTTLLAKINDIRLWAEGLQQSEAGGELVVPDTTTAMFADYYREYHKRCAAETLPATLIPRVQTFVWKFALLYAAMAASERILPEHLEPAILAGNYFEQSVLQVFRTFGASRGKEVEDKLLSFLRSKERGVPMLQRDVYRALNLSAAELEQAAKPLVRLGLLKNSSRFTDKGREVLCYEAL